MSSNSPCIDAGMTDVLYNDLDGSRNDIGAFGGSNININTSSIDFGIATIQRDTIYVQERDLVVYNGRNTDFNLNYSTLLTEHFLISVPSLPFCA